MSGAKSHFHRLLLALDDRARMVSPASVAQGVALANLSVLALLGRCPMGARDPKDLLKAEENP